jgi:hypothetical protein
MISFYYKNHFTGTQKSQDTLFPGKKKRVPCPVSPPPPEKATLPGVLVGNQPDTTKFGNIVQKSVGGTSKKHEIFRNFIFLG